MSNTAVVATGIYLGIVGYFTFTHVRELYAHCRQMDVHTHAYRMLHSWMLFWGSFGFLTFIGHFVASSDVSRPWYIPLLLVPLGVSVLVWLTSYFALKYQHRHHQDTSK